MGSRHSADAPKVLSVTNELRRMRLPINLLTEAAETFPRQGFDRRYIAIGWDGFARHDAEDALFDHLEPMPFLLRVYVALSIVALVWFLLGLSTSLKGVTALTHPYIGWSGTFSYAASLIPIGTVYFSRSPNRPRLQLLFLFPLSIILVGTFEIYTVLRDGNSGPDHIYVWMHPFRPFFSILLPLFWLYVFSLPSVRSWLKVASS